MENHPFFMKANPSCTTDSSMYGPLRVNSSCWKGGIYQQGTTTVCNKTPTEAYFLAAQKWFNRLNLSLTG